MPIKNHHAHIFIGEPNKTSEELVVKYLEEEGLGTQDTDFHISNMELFTIDDARDLKRLISERPHLGKKMVVLVSVANFSHPAQHALLKTLEEPQKDAFIIFITPREHTLLPTIKSRVFIHYLASSELVSPIDVKIFEKVSVAKRLKMVEEYLHAIKNDSDLHETSRRDALAFLHAYESHLHGIAGVGEKKKEYEAIFFAKEYISDQGSSVKQLLEYVALVK